MHKMVIVWLSVLLLVVVAMADPGYGGYGQYEDYGQGHADYGRGGYGGRGHYSYGHGGRGGRGDYDYGGYGDSYHEGQGYAHGGYGEGYRGYGVYGRY
ncbi:neuropeptide-like protein 31 [Homarus americanus]|uniref:neuropeptide-like protein 31 n=1 Tax=Homarus americanus TaxID=6706 RepID=UPI001C47A5C4|nr:neuropeptide-like protein 31 [Homarus americanus]